MYFYYFLMAIKIRPPWAMMVTVLQISQMFVGVTFTVLNFIYVGSDQCTISHSNNLAAFGMYGSYLFLFLQFFISRYFVKSSQKKTRKKEAWTQTNTHIYRVPKHISLLSLPNQTISCSKEHTHTLQSYSHMVLN